MNLVTRIGTVDDACALCRKKLSGRISAHTYEMSEHCFHESCVVNTCVQSILLGYSPSCPTCSRRIEYLDSLQLPPPLPMEGTIPEPERIGHLPRTVAQAARAGHRLVVRKFLETHPEMIKPNLRLAIPAAAGVNDFVLTNELLHLAGKQFCEMVRRPRPLRDRDLPPLYPEFSEVPDGAELIDLLFERRMLTAEGVAGAILEGVKRNASETATALIPHDVPTAIRIFGTAIRLAAESNDPQTWSDGSWNLFQRLLDLGPISDANRGDAVMEAVKNKNSIGLQILLNSGSISHLARTKAVNRAADMGSVEMIHLLQPIDDEQRIEAIEIAIQSGKPNVLHELLNGWERSSTEKALDLAKWAPMAIASKISEETTQKLLDELNLWSPITDDLRGKIFIPVVEKGWILMMNRLLKEGVPNDVFVAAWPVALKVDDGQLASDLYQFRQHQMSRVRFT